MLKVSPPPAGVSQKSHNLKCATLLTSTVVSFGVECSKRNYDKYGGRDIHDIQNEYYRLMIIITSDIQIC